MNNQSTGAYAPQTGTVYLNDLPTNTQIVAFGHRSGAETHQACPRRYFLNYEYLGRGITPNPGPLYLAVGTAVHHGLANMLLLGKELDECIQAALDSLMQSAAFAAVESEETHIEQCVLVEGLLYSFWVYALPGLLADFEVLCVETGAVEYIPFATQSGDASSPYMAGDENIYGVNVQYVAIQSRPDAILRNRKTHEVCGISWKTIDDPSDMRRSQLVNDLQGFMELYYGERILEKLAGAPVTREEIAEHLREHLKRLTQDGYDPIVVLEALQDDIETLEKRTREARNIPTTIDYIQTIFLVKGPRKLIDPNEGVSTPAEWHGDSPDEYGGYQPGKVYRQMSHLCYRYRNGNFIDPSNQIVEFYKSGPNKGKPKPTAEPTDPNYQEESWQYRFYKPGNETGSALSPKWLTSQIYPDQIRGWVDKLNRGEVYPSTINDPRNPHPLAKIIRFEEPLYKDPKQVLSHVKQQHNRFVQIARAKQTWESEGVYGLIEALDELYPQHLISCRTPYKCAYHNFCHGAELVQIDFNTIPEGFELRQPHHQAEREHLEQQEKDEPEG